MYTFKYTLRLARWLTKNISHLKMWSVDSSSSLNGAPKAFLPLPLLIRRAGAKGFVFNQYKFKSLVIALQAAPGVKGTLLVYKTAKIVVAGSNSMRGACRLVEMFIREYLEDSCGLYGYSFDTQESRTSCVALTFEAL